MKKWFNMSAISLAFALSSILCMIFYFVSAQFCTPDKSPSFNIIIPVVLAVLCLVLGPLNGVLAAVLGHIARRMLRKERAVGGRAALLGLGLGYLSIAVWILLIAANVGILVTAISRDLREGKFNFYMKSANVHKEITYFNPDGTVDSKIVVPSKLIDVESMLKISESGITVYYPAAAFRSQAEEVFGIISQGHKEFGQVMGMPLGNVAIVLYGPLKENEYVPSVNTVNGTIPIPLGLIIKKKDDAPRLENDYCMLMHEFTEGRVISMTGVPLYLNEYMRWVGDGLAEYMANWGMRHIIPKECLRRLCELKERLDELPLKEYDLTLWKVAGGGGGFIKNTLFSSDASRAKKERETLGAKARYYSSDCSIEYALSFAFWLDLTEQNGESILKKFLHDLSEMTLVSNYDICKILEKHTGKPLHNTICRFNVEHAKKVIDKAIASIEKEQKEKAKTPAKQSP